MISNYKISLFKISYDVHVTSYDVIVLFRTPEFIIASGKFIGCSVYCDGKALKPIRKHEADKSRPITKVTHST